MGRQDLGDRVKRRDRIARVESKRPTTSVHIVHSDDAPPSTALVELLAAIVAEHRRAKT